MMNTVKKQENVRVTSTARAYLCAMWRARNTGASSYPKIGPVLREIVMSALAGDFIVSAADFSGTRSEEVGMVLDRESALRLAENPLGVSKSSYAASALEAYMLLHPLPESALAPFYPENQRDLVSADLTATARLSEETNSLRSRISTIEAQLATANETISRSAETIATLTRLLEQERVRVPHP